MKTYRFVCEEHEEFGSLGWKVEGDEDQDPTDGLGIAHDILEHFPSVGFGIHGEFMAFGAMLWIRGETGELDNHYSHSSYETMGWSFGDILTEDLPFPEPPRTIIRDPNLEDMLDVIINEARKFLIDEDVYEEITPSVEHNLQKARVYMRIGYRKAIRRYGYDKQWGLTYLFKRIEEDVDKHLKGAEEGDILYLKIDYTSLNHGCIFKQDYEEDPYYEDNPH